MSLKNVLRSAVNRLGFDVVRLKRSPQRTLLGLSRLNIGTIINVGANQGQFARLISGFFPRAELYCFEPLEEPFRQLSAWAQAQNSRVHCFQLALGEQDGEMEMHLHEQHTPSSSLLASTDTCHRLYPQTQAERMTRIRVSTLDRALEDALDTCHGKFCSSWMYRASRIVSCVVAHGCFRSARPLCWRSASILFTRGKRIFMDSRNCSTRLVSATREISTRPMVRTGGWCIWMRCL